jgi:hypothetical protein
MAKIKNTKNNRHGEKDAADIKPCFINIKPKQGSFCGGFEK